MSGSPSDGPFAFSQPEIQGWRERLPEPSNKPSVAGVRRPIHTVYGGAHLYRAGLSKKIGERALESLERFAPDGIAFARAFGLVGSDAYVSKIRNRVIAKLRDEPVEDYRIDFEDGYGSRPPEEEDRHVRQAALALAQDLETGTAAPSVGIRLKAIGAHMERSLRTLGHFVSLVAPALRVAKRTLLVTLPKVCRTEEIAVAREALERLESELALEAAQLRLELMVESAAALVGPTGELRLEHLVAEAGIRCHAVHFGTNDFLSEQGVVGTKQRLDHPIAVMAKSLMKISLRGRDVCLVDGTTTTLPIAPSRAAAGETLSDAQNRENRSAVCAAWSLHAANVRHSLSMGYVQSWDLHPAQLPARYAAVYDCLLSDIDAVAVRLSDFVEQAAQARRTGTVFDDAATAQGLVNHVLTAVRCGALLPEEASTMTGVSYEELSTRSFQAMAVARVSVQE